MASFQAAARTIEAGLKTGQIGQPVAVRIVAHDCDGHEQIELLAAEALAHAAEWLGHDPDLLTAGGSVQSGQMTVLAKFGGGQSALISAGVSGVERPLLAVEVWGNRGVLTWEDACDESPHPNETLLSPKSEMMLNRLQQALASRDSIVSAVPTSHPWTRAHTNRKPQAPPYGVLLIAGDHTHQPAYAEALAADARCRLIGLTDAADVSARRRTLNERFAARLGLPVLDDLRAALSREDVHIVSICAEPYRRGPIAVLAAEAGKHLYLDKPLAGSVADADAIIAAASQAGVVAHMFSSVHSCAANRARSIIESGALGDLTAIHFDLCFAKGRAGTAALGQPRTESGVPERFELVESKREFSNVGVYPLVQLLTLVGHHVHAVTATTGNYFFREHQQHDMEDFGQMLLEFDGGLVASVSAGRTGWRSHPGGGLNRTFLIGTTGCAVVDAHRPRVEVWADVDPWRPPERDPEDPMGMWAAPPGSPFTIAPRQSWLTPPPSEAVTDVTHFLNCIEQGTDSMVSAELAAMATEILFAGYRSAASGATAELPLPR